MALLGLVLLLKSFARQSHHEFGSYSRDFLFDDLFDDKFNNFVLFPFLLYRFVHLGSDRLGTPLLSFDHGHVLASASKLVQSLACTVSVSFWKAFLFFHHFMLVTSQL